MKHYFLLILFLYACNDKSKINLTSPIFENKKEALKIGDKVDSLNHVYVYYNGSVGHVLNRHVAKDGYNLGLKYQCVEFVKRYYYEFYKHKMPNSYGHAKDFYNSKIADGAYSADRDLLQYQNPSLSKPKVGDLLIFDGHVFNPYGHVAIVSKVFDNEIEIIQQNPGPSAPSRVVFELKFENNKWLIDKSDLLGWLRK
jgi:surface antigen